jgi:hypothetical protein
MQLYKDLAQLVHATETAPLVLGGVEFWIENDTLVYSKPTSVWWIGLMGVEVENLSKYLPAVKTIVLRYA